MKRTLLIFTVIAAAVMELIDISIVNVALSQMSGNLGASLEDTSWVITSYAIANVIIIPMTSFLVARLGRRNYFIGSIILFTLFSLLCGSATNIWGLVVFRFFQGIGGGALLSVSQAVVFENFPKEKQNIASALFGIGVFVGPTIGPTLGGYITENYSWPWIFFINVPIGITVATLCIFLLEEPVIKPSIPKVDWLGIFLLSVGVGSLQIVLERGEIEDWFDTHYIVYLTIAAVLSLTLFVFWELNVKEPVVNLRVLKSKSLSVAAVLTFVTGFGLFTSVFLTPVFAQRILDYPPFQTGLLLLPGAVLAIFALMFSATILRKGVSPNLVIFSGFLSFMLFTWKMSELNLDAAPADFMVPLIFRSIGLALLTVPLTTLAVSSLEPKDVPQGAALNNMMRQLGGSFGIASLNTYIANRLAVNRNDLVSNITLQSHIATDKLTSFTNTFLSKGYDITEAQHRSFKLMDAIITRQSYLLSYMNAYLMVGLVFLAALPLLLLVIKRKGGTNVVVMSDH